MPDLLLFTDIDRGFEPAGADDAPTAMSIVAALAGHGIAAEYVPFFKPPWNPLAGQHALWRAIDPARAVWAMLRRRKMKVLLSIVESGAVVPLALRPLFRRPILVMHDSDHADWRPRRIVQEFVLPRADLVLTQTHAQAEYLVRQFTLRRPPFYVGPRIDEAFFRPDPAAGPGDYALAVGNDAARDFSLLVEAAAGLDLELKLLTRLPVPQPTGARARIEVIDRRVSYRELRTLYAGARLVALPLRQRISPGGMTSLLEAMAMGKPYVLSASSGVTELAEDGVTGRVVPIGDTAAFGAALAELWTDPARAAAMGAAGRARVERDFSTAARARRLAAAMDMVLPGPSATRPGPNIMAANNRHTQAPDD
ncbi:glycosyltransferase family 4 protein [Falsiroseomonas sp.]|uniref:glycosyltransferase family 4 protein n=1 Tax=Falsiroseomonas sp. TaxID=2870721 RepID=UPI0035659474